MKLNYSTLSTAVRWVSTTLVCVLAATFVWQGMFFLNTAAIAAPAANLIASTHASDQVKDKANEDAGRAKSFIRDTADRVERTAKRNADRVEEATDEKGGLFSGKAKRDAARIEQRAEQDASRTQKAVDKTKNAVKGAADKVKDTFSK